MSDIVQTLRECADESGYFRQFKEAADEIEALRSRLAECEADRLEQCRLNGMGSSREAHLMARLAEEQEARRNTITNYTNDCNRLLAIIEADRARLAEAECDMDQLIGERDHAQDMADKLADAVATLLGVEIGEHSSMNCPWAEALEAFEDRATDSAAHNKLETGKHNKLDDSLSLSVTDPE